MSRMEAAGANAPQIEYWNGPAGDKWARLTDVQERMLGALGTAAMDVCDIQSGHSVLDVGCGSGMTSIEIAHRVGAAGRVLGIDISTPMLNVGRTRLGELGIENVTFENQDAAVYRFADSFDRVYSRFGTTFFADPVGAFSNIRRGMQPGGRLGFVCWQAPDNNAWIDIPLRVVLRHVSAPPPTNPEAPGPLAFANPDRVRNILSEAGYSDIEIDALETAIPIEPDVPGSVRRLFEVGPVSRLLSDISDDVMERLQSDLSDEIAGFQTADGVMMDSATWIIRARSP